MGKKQETTSKLALQFQYVLTTEEVKYNERKQPKILRWVLSERDISVGFLFFFSGILYFFLFSGFSSVLIDYFSGWKTKLLNKKFFFNGDTFKIFHSSPVLGGRLPEVSDLSTLPRAMYDGRAIPGFAQSREKKIENNIGN